MAMRGANEEFAIDAAFRGYSSPEDTQKLKAEIERLREIKTAAQEYREYCDQAYRDGEMSHVINNTKQQRLWRALDASVSETPKEDGK